MKRTKKLYRGAGVLLAAAMVTLVFSGCFWTDPDPSTLLYGDVREGEDPGYLGNTNDYFYVNETNFVTNILGTNIVRIEDFQGDGLHSTIRPHRENYYPGMYDIHEVVVSADDDYVYVYVAMQERYYRNAYLAELESAAGFYQPLIAIFFADASTGNGGTWLDLYSPEDGTPAQLYTLLGTTGIDVDYGAAVVGMTFPNAGTVFDAYNSSAPGRPRTGPNLATISTNEIISTPMDYNVINPSESTISTVFAFKVARSDGSTEFLTSGNWKFFVMTYNWEDYGLEDCYPGNNGHLRENTEGTPTSYAFGLSGGGDYCNFCDILSTNSGRQEAIFESGGSTLLTTDDFFEITLP